MNDSLAIFIPAFITLFVIIDPVGLAPIFAGLTDKTSKHHQRKMALKGSVVGACILLFFALAGKPFLGALGISMEALRIAGGTMLFLISLEMVFEKRMERKQEAAEKIEDVFDDVSVFPVAIPLIAGPGSIASIILLMTNQENSFEGQLIVIGALASVLFISLIAFLLAARVMGLMGETVSTVLTRVLGIILAALAAQFIIDGIKGAFIG